MQFLVHGVDRPGADEELERLVGAHWSYMDGYVDRLVARGPTLSPDGERHTGSVHVVEVDALEEAQRFAFDEPFWLAGLYATVTVTRFQDLVGGTMWDRPATGPVSSLVLADAAVDHLDHRDSVVFGGALLTPDGAHVTGFVVAMDLEPAQAVARLSLPSGAGVLSTRWQRGGRPG